MPDRLPRYGFGTNRSGVQRGPILVVCLLMVAGCTADRGPDSGRTGGAEAGPARLETVIDDLDGPTQFVVDGARFVVAVLNGGENDGTGQIIEIDQDGRRAVLFDGLDKPTGVLVRGDEIWIMERDRLSRGPRAGGPRTVVADGLPNNGRSQGTLTLTPDDLVLFNTSGSARDGVVRDRSGRLWTVGDDGLVEEYASGFKNAYAHVFGPDGALWTTEIGDGRFDGERPADEVVRVTEGVDHGWPRCVGDNRPVAEFGVTDCTGVPGSQSVFNPQATPTGMTLLPGDPDRLVVTLWATGELVTLSRTEPSEPTVVLDGLSGPQHLVAADGTLYLSEFGTGRIARVIGVDR